MGVGGNDCVGVPCGRDAGIRAAEGAERRGQLARQQQTLESDLAQVASRQQAAEQELAERADALRLQQEAFGRQTAAWETARTQEEGRPGRGSQTAGGRSGEGRERVAKLFACKPSEVIFTSGATESCNLAVFGTARLLKDKGRHLITSAVEHHAVLSPSETLSAREGFELTILPVNRDGRVWPDDLEKAIRPDTVLVSIMAANNEIGSVQAAAELGALCRKHGVLFHTVAVQRFGKQPFSNIHQFNADLVSACPHKLHGPKGAGVLFMDHARGLAEQRAVRKASLPARVAEAVRVHGLDGLLEVILDLGRVPTARYPTGEVVLAPDGVQEQEIEHVVAQISAFGEDNRAGIPRKVLIVAPPGHSRALDYLNQMEPFFQLETARGPRLVNRDFVQVVRPLD